MYKGKSTNQTLPWVSLKRVPFLSPLPLNLSCEFLVFSAIFYLYFFSFIWTLALATYRIFWKRGCCRRESAKVAPLVSTQAQRPLPWQRATTTQPVDENHFLKKLLIASQSEGVRGTTWAASAAALQNHPELHLLAEAQSCRDTCAGLDCLSWVLHVFPPSLRVPKSAKMFNRNLLRDFEDDPFMSWVTQVKLAQLY